MGVLFSKAAREGLKHGRVEYERVLSELDSQIQQQELALAETRVAERRASVYFFFYSLLFSCCTFAYLFLASRHRSLLFDAFLLVGAPLGIYYLKKGLSFYYRRRINGLESSLQALRARQKLKLDELKDSTAYYQTRVLIERFDPEFKKSGGNDGPSKDGQKEASKPATAPPPPAKPPHQQRPHQQSQQQSADPVAFVLQPEPKKTWMDRLVDAMIGDDSRHSKYALICQRCHAHNGLALPDEVLSVVFVCPNCHFENKPKPRQNLTINGENVYTPVKTAEQDAPSDPETPQALRNRAKNKLK